MTSDHPLGMYGKIPTLGDFVSRRLPGEFIRPWDEWLQDAISSSKQRLGENWLDIYLTSPIWRFILTPGVCGNQAWAGVLIPSVDRVGRYFPLTLASRIPEKSAVPGFFVRAQAWFMAVEDIALAALQDDFNITKFENKSAAPFTDDDVSSKSPSGENAGGHDNPFFSFEMETPAELPTALIHLSDGLIKKQMPVCSAWTSTGSDHAKPGLRIYETLPPAEAYTNFLADQENQQRRSDSEPN